MTRSSRLSDRDVRKLFRNPPPTSIDRAGNDYLLHLITILAKEAEQADWIRKPGISAAIDVLEQLRASGLANKVLTIKKASAEIRDRWIAMDYVLRGKDQRDGADDSIHKAIANDWKVLGEHTLRHTREKYAALARRAIQIFVDGGVSESEAIEMFRHRTSLWRQWFQLQTSVKRRSQTKKRASKSG